MLISCYISMHSDVAEVLFCVLVYSLNATLLSYYVYEVFPFRGEYVEDLTSCLCFGC